MSRTPRWLHVLIAAAVLLTTPAFARAQRVTDPARLMALSQRLKQKWETRRGAAFQAFLNSQDPWIRALNADPNMRLVYIDESGRPVYHRNNDLISAETVSTDEVWPGGPAGFSLDGLRTGWQTYLAIWEATGGPRLTHQEFNGRVWLVDPVSEVEHATRVAGILMASGVNPDAKGMSPNASLFVFDSANDASEMAYWAGLGLTVSSHSYSATLGWNVSGGLWTWFGDLAVSTTEDEFFGKYTSDAQDWDEVAYNAPTYTIVGGAGNDRNDAGPAPGTLHAHFTSGVPSSGTDNHPADGGTTGYDTMPPAKCAKNMITVGGINDIPGGWTAPGDAQTTNFSSWGPTDDGRIKPDVVANALNLTAPDSGADNAYTTNASGCSYAGPAVAGSVNLIYQEWENKFPSGNDPRSSTVKALLAHTADEAGLDGPDYIYGWGVMNTRRAVELVDADGPIFYERILEPTLQDGETDEFDFWWGGKGPIKVTMAWTDPPGTPPGTGVDIQTPMLVNDLDLRVTGLGLFGTTHEPWVMFPLSPAFPATTGDNTLDNVEQVYVSDVPAGYYRATVTHKGQLDSGSQDYSLILPAPKHVCITLVPLPPSWFEDNPGWWHQWSDVDGDRRLDMCLLDSLGTQHIYRNQGGSLFTRSDIASVSDLGASREAAWADVDNDGDLDCFVGGNGTANQLFRNNGAGIFIDVWSDPLPSNVLDAAWVDANNDGRLDLYLARGGQPNRLYRNDGSMTFTDVTPPALAYAGDTQQAAWANIDADPWPEVFLANSDGPSRLIDATGSGYAVIQLPAPGSTSYGAAWADVNNDGQWDLYVANQSAPDRLFLWDQGGYVAGNLPDLGPGNGSRPGVVFADLDLDGDVDAVLPHRGRILQNAGTGVFVAGPALPTSGLPYSSASVADEQEDGHLELYLGRADGGALLGGDPCDDGHWVAIDLIGDISNRDALGTVVTIYAGGQTQKRQVGTGSGARGEGPLRVHFGLGSATVIDSLRIDWPSGRTQHAVMAPVDQLIVLPEAVRTEVEVAAAPQGESSLHIPNPLVEGSLLRYRISESGPVSLAVYSIEGRLVRRLADGVARAGEHEVIWDGKDSRGSLLSAGVYFLRFEAGGRSNTNRVIYAR